MDESKLKNQIVDAMREPAVPAELVERTVVRAAAITAGRAAEQRLAEQGSRLSRQETAELTAKGIVGRLMLTAAPPAGTTAEAMASRLTESAQFRQMAELPPEDILGELHTGRFLSRFRDQPDLKIGSPAPAPVQEKSGPDIAPPSLQTPHL